MTVTVTLTPAEEARLVRIAHQAGVAPETLAHQLLVAQLVALAPPAADEDPTLALFAQWDAEDAKMTLAERQEAQEAYTTFIHHVDEERARVGARRLYQ